MRKVRVKATKRTLAAQLGRTPTKTEFRRAKRAWVRRGSQS